MNNLKILYRLNIFGFYFKIFLDMCWMGTFQYYHRFNGVSSTTNSKPMGKVKQHRAGLVFRWVCTQQKMLIDMPVLEI